MKMLAEEGPGAALVRHGHWWARRAST